MTEREYLLATDLRSIRLAMECLRGVVSVDPTENALIVSALSAWEQTLAQQVREEVGDP